MRLFWCYSQESESTLVILSKFRLFFAFISARWRQNNFQSPELFELLQNAQFTWQVCANRSNNFWVRKENVAIWQKYRFCHPIGQMDLRCPLTIRSEICWKCRETIPLVQVCFKFVLSFTVLKLLSKIWVNLWNFDQIFAVFGDFLREMASEEF